MICKLPVCRLALALILFSAASRASADEPRWWTWWFGDCEEARWWHVWFGDPRIDGKQVEEDELVLRGARLGVTGPELLGFVRSLVPTAEDEKKISELVKLTDSATLKERAKATAALKNAGPQAISLIRGKLAGAPWETAVRLEACLKALTEKTPPHLQAAAIRLIRVRRPEGSIAGLIALAPFASDEAVRDEIFETVFLLGYRKAKVDPALDQALADPMPARRGLAAVVVGIYGTEEQRRRVKGLLADPDSEVRFQAAMGLAGGGDPACLPVLVETLKSGPFRLAERADDLLRQIARDRAPRQALVETQAGREECHLAWNRWLQEDSSKVGLIAVDANQMLANVDSRVREIVRIFAESIFSPKAEKSKLIRIIDAPFYASGQVLSTRRELEDAVLQELAQTPEQSKASISLKKIVRVSQFVAEPRTPEQEKAFLTTYAKGESRVALVHLDLEVMGMRVSFDAAMFVRIQGARGRLIGVGSATEAAVNKGP